MSVERTPQGHGQAQAAFSHPPPQAQVVMSNDQFQALIDTVKPASPAPAVAMAQGDGGPDFPNVSAVAVKLPTFWTSDPELWFLRV